MYSTLTKYSKDQPRDSQGRFTSGGGSPRDNYEALARGKDVTIDPHELRPLLQEAAKGENSSLNTDLTNLHINGVQLFDKPNLGVSRGDMPQVPTNAKAEFIQELNKSGISSQNLQVNPLDLNPVQKEIQAEKSGGIMSREEAKNADPRLVPDSGRSIVSSDNYIMDGHHRWAAYSAMALEDPNVKIPVIKVDMTHEDLMPVLQAFADKYNIPSIKMGQDNEYKAAMFVAQRKFDALVYTVVQKNLLRNSHVS